MEGWEIRRRSASFRGVPLEVLSSSRSGGRRLDVHEFAGRDLPYAEDLGRAARSFTVRGLFLGDDHDVQADELRKAFEREGPGELVLPHSSPIQVAVASFRIEEGAGEARVQRFEAEFVEFGAPATPAVRPDTVGQVRTRVGETFQALRAAFSVAWAITGTTQAIIDAGRAVAQAGAESVREALEEIQAVNELSGKLDSAVKEVDSLEKTIAAQAASSELAASAFESAIDTLAELPAAPEAVFQALSRVSSFGDELDRPAGDTVARARLRANHDALVGMVRGMGLAARARVASRITFESSTGAAELRDELSRAFDVEIATASAAGDDVTANRLRTLRAAMIRDIDTRAAKLPLRVEWMPPRVMSSLEISQRLYGTPDRAEEIVNRNPVAARKPSRIAASAALEVLAS